MTTGQDDTGRRSSGPNLLAPLPEDPAAPGADPSALEELRTAVLEMREELAGLRKDAQAERPAPVTREELDAWGERLLKRFDDEGVPERAVADDGVLIVAECAARMTDAARGIETGAAQAEKRLTARIGAAEEVLAGKLAGIDTTGKTDAIREQVGGISSALGEFRRRADSRFNDIASVVLDTREKMDGLKFGRHAFLAPWAIFVFAAGMFVESVGRPLYRLIWGG